MIPMRGAGRDYQLAEEGRAVDIHEAIAVLCAIPCTHPARRGHHEMYTGITGVVCRACGAEVHFREPK